MKIRIQTIYNEDFIFQNYRNFTIKDNIIEFEGNFKPRQRYSVYYFNVEDITGFWRKGLKPIKEIY